MKSKVIRTEHIPLSLVPPLWKMIRYQMNDVVSLPVPACLCVSVCAWIRHISLVYLRSVNTMRQFSRLILIDWPFFPSPFEIGTLLAGCFKLVRGTNDTTPFGVEKMSENTDCNNSFSGKIQPNEILMNHKLRIKCKHCLAAHFWQADITFYFWLDCHFHGK